MTARSKAKLLHLLPGQEVPVHPHPDLEMILFPQRGEATLIAQTGPGNILKAGTVYNTGVGLTFGLKNTGAEFFQVLVFLVPALMER